MFEVVSLQDIEVLALRLGIVDTDKPAAPINLDSDDGESKEGSLELDGGFGNILVCDNLPLFPPKMLDTVKDILLNWYGEFGVIREGGVWIPVHPLTRWGVGYCFVQYDTHKEAEDARRKTNGYRMKMGHTFAVNMYVDYEYTAVQDRWTPAEPNFYAPTEYLSQWLNNDHAMDQFVIHASAYNQVCWNDPNQLMPDVVLRHRYCVESFVQWSPLGTYLATVHREGVAIQGGASTFNCLMRYSHPQVSLIDFSPGERYLVTCSSSHGPNNRGETHRIVLNIFNLCTGEVMRNFEGNADEFTTGKSDPFSGVLWPLIRWSGGRNDRYFAVLEKDLIYIYETRTFELIDENPLSVENVRDFSWSPTETIIALFVPENSHDNQQAMIRFIQVPSKVEIQQKIFVNVSDCKMYWQSNGEYLAVKVDMYTETKKSTYTRFELFCLKERDIPSEVLELDNKNDKIVAFAWEPNGHRFAVIHGDGPLSDISFYSVRTSQNAACVSRLTTLKSKQANALYWSPGGRFIVFAGLEGFNGQLEFYDVDELESMATCEHFMAASVEWDPSGRYVATSVTSVHDTKNGFHLWSSHGKLLYVVCKDNLYQFQWRPRPTLQSRTENEERDAWVQE